jgi:hypothetical protein
MVTARKDIAFENELMRRVCPDEAIEAGMKPHHYLKFMLKEMRDDLNDPHKEALSMFNNDFMDAKQIIQEEIDLMTAANN